MPVYSDCLRRTVDIAIAAVIAVAAVPVVVLTAIVIALVMGRPVLFCQTRIGRKERPFELYKFRTMRTSAEAGGTASDVERLSTFGSWLRSTSLDELPQLWNVLKGEMSLIGPRPLLPQYLARYTAFQRRRHEVRPGITGWAQVKGRNAISWEEKFRLDVWYVDQRSLRLDCTILLLTLGAVLTRRGIAADGHVTIPEFHGSIAQE